MKNYFRLSYYLILLILIFQSCSNENIEQLSETPTEQFNNIYGKGCGIKDTETHSKFNDDTIGIDDVFSSACSTFTNNSSINLYRYDPFRIFPNGGEIKVYSYLESTTTQGENWDSYLETAIGYWNSIDTCINFVIVNNVNDADIRIESYSTVFPETLGDNPYQGEDIDPTDTVHPLPSQYLGNYHSLTLINLEFDINPDQDIIEYATENQKRKILAHELGHTIGFKHESATSFPEIPDLVFYGDSSIMIENIVGRSDDIVGLIPNDFLALEYLYDCNDGIYTTVEAGVISIGTMSPFCYSDNFEISGNFETTAGSGAQLSLYIVEIEQGGNINDQTGNEYLIDVDYFTNNSFNFSGINLTEINDINFNLENTYKIKVVITSIENSTPCSNITLPFNTDCDDIITNPLCQNPCKFAGSIFNYVNNENGAYTLYVEETVLNSPCFAGYTFQWSLVIGETSTFLGHGASLTTNIDIPSFSPPARIYLDLYYESSNPNESCKRQIYRDL